MISKAWELFSQLVLWVIACSPQCCESWRVLGLQVAQCLLRVLVLAAMVYAIYWLLTSVPGSL